MWLEHDRIPQYTAQVPFEKQAKKQPHDVACGVSILASIVAVPVVGLILFLPCLREWKSFASKGGLIPLGRDFRPSVVHLALTAFCLGLNLLSCELCIM